MLAEISWTSKEAALRLISMPFLTSIEVADRKAMEYLLRLADSGPNRLDMFLSKAEINDGITDENAWLIPLMYLRAVDEESAEAIEGMPWVADGIAFFEPDSTLWIHPNPARYEEEIVGLLVNGATESPRLIKALTERPWLWTAPSYRGNRVVTLLIGIAREHEQTALKILEMPFLETIDAYDEVALTSLGAISGLHPDRLNAVLADPRLAGGITDETSVLTGLMWLELDDPPTASALSALPWIADGITAEEVDAALLLQELAVEAPRVARALAQKPWTADGVSDDEYSVIWASMAMTWAPVSEVYHSLVLDIFDMPFLDSVEPADTAAVWSLQELSWEFNEGQMRPLLFHPALQGASRTPRRSWLELFLSFCPINLNSWTCFWTRAGTPWSKGPCASPSRETSPSRWYEPFQERREQLTSLRRSCASRSSSWTCPSPRTSSSCWSVTGCPANWDSVPTASRLCPRG